MRRKSQMPAYWQWTSAVWHGRRESQEAPVTEQASTDHSGMAVHMQGWEKGKFQSPHMKCKWGERLRQGKRAEINSPKPSVQEGQQPHSQALQVFTDQGRAQRSPFKAFWTSQRVEASPSDYPGAEHPGYHRSYKGQKAGRVGQENTEGSPVTQKAGIQGLKGSKFLIIPKAGGSV